MDTESKKKTRCTNRQKKALIDYMSTHSLFANGEFSGPLGCIKYKDEWVKLKTHLDEIGPAKPLIAWQRTWRDLKKKARCENSVFRRGLQTTGNATEIIPVGELSQKVLGIIGMASSTGIGPSESGIAMDDSYVSQFAEVPRSSSPALSLTSCDQEPLSTSPRLHQTDIRRSRTRVAPSVATATEFQSLQKETNEIFKGLLQELKKSNNLKEKQNALLEQQNMILKNDRSSYKHTNVMSLEIDDEDVSATASPMPLAKLQMPLVKPKPQETIPLSDIGNKNQVIIGQKAAKLRKLTHAEIEAMKCKSGVMRKNGPLQTDVMYIDSVSSSGISIRK